MTPDEPSPSNLRAVTVPRRDLSRLEPLIGRERFSDLVRAAADGANLLQGKTVWNVSSTSAGGGVAEMLQVLVGYILDAGIDVRWLVIEGDREFFEITKRVHNRLHATPGDPGQLGPSQAAHYEQVLGANADLLVRQVRRGDVVLLHDPQTAGLAGALSDAGSHVVWRCHVGTETRNDWTEEAWSFLRPHLVSCKAFVFSVRGYVPQWMQHLDVRVIPPSIDPFSPKNQDLSPQEVLAILGSTGMVSDPGGHLGSFVRRDGTAATVTRRAQILRADPAPLDAGVPLVVQVSRWDHLKDMSGVMEGFVSKVSGRCRAHLALVGPSTGEVEDDPEGAEVFSECEARWRGLSAEARRTVSLVTLPMDDIDENAAMVNAFQRHSTVIVQKSLAEGFGLTVAEGMWKAKAVVASAVGGITAQIAPGTGVLVEDPADLDSFGGTLAALLADPAEISALGKAAHRHVLECFVGDLHLIRYGELLQDVMS